MKIKGMKIILGTVMVFTLCAVFVITLKYANSFTEYEIHINDGKPSEFALNRTAVKSYDDIPYSENYVLKLENNFISVYGNSGERIYSEPITHSQMLSHNDIIELEQHGMYFSDRSQLIEILNYLNS